jgi:hypothetical protein
MLLRCMITVCLALALLGSPPGFAAQSTITEAEGYSCPGIDKSRREAETEALAEARRRAVENVKTHVTSATTVKDAAVEKDIIEAYARASVQVVRELERTWYRDPAAGECIRIRIQAEVIPEEGVLARLAGGKEGLDDPTAPLNVKVWTDRKVYRQGERIKIFLKGNKPFYARVLYRDAAGDLLQLLPNAHRRDNYFHGGMVYEVPAGNDRFELEVSPPFGPERIVVYAGTAPLGDLSLEEAGGVYQVRTRSADVGISTRGLKITGKQAGSDAAAEFVEAEERLTTAPR